MARVVENKTQWYVKEPNGHIENIPKDGRWQFDGDYDDPTFSPSLNITWGGEGTEVPFTRNHFIVTAGKIAYCTDSTHEKAGGTYDLLVFTEYETSHYTTDW